MTVAVLRASMAESRGMPNAALRLRSVGLAGLAQRLEALLLLRRIRRELTRRPFKELQAEFVERTAVARKPEPAGERALAIGRAVESAARFVPGARCVAQSLAAQTMLSRRGVPSTIQFGFRRAESGSVEGHAWLEAEGRVVAGDGDLQGFTRTAVFEA